MADYTFTIKGLSYQVVAATGGDATTATDDLAVKYTPADNTTTPATTESYEITKGNDTTTKYAFATKDSTVYLVGLTESQPPSGYTLLTANYPIAVTESGSAATVALTTDVLPTTASTIELTGDKVTFSSPTVTTKEVAAQLTATTGASGYNYTPKYNATYALDSTDNTSKKITVTATAPGSYNIKGIADTAKAENITFTAGQNDGAATFAIAQAALPQSGQTDVVVTAPTGGKAPNVTLTDVTTVTPTATATFTANTLTYATDVVTTAGYGASTSGGNATTIPWVPTSNGTSAVISGLADGLTASTDLTPADGTGTITLVANKITLTNNVITITKDAIQEATAAQGQTAAVDTTIALSGDGAANLTLQLSNAQEGSDTAFASSSIKGVGEAAPTETPAALTPPENPDAGATSATYTYTGAYTEEYVSTTEANKSYTWHAETAHDTFTISGLKYSANSQPALGTDVIVATQPATGETTKKVTITAAALPENPTAASPAVALSGANSSSYSLDMSQVESTAIPFTWTGIPGDNGTSTYTFTISGNTAGWVADTQNAGQYTYRAASGGQQFVVTGLQSGLKAKDAQGNDVTDANTAIAKLPIQYTVDAQTGAYTFYLTDGVVIDATTPAEQQYFAALTSDSKITIAYSGRVTSTAADAALDTTAAAPTYTLSTTGTGTQGQEGYVPSLTAGATLDAAWASTGETKISGESGFAYTTKIETAYGWSLSGTSTATFTPQVGGDTPFAIFGLEGITQANEVGTKVTVSGTGGTSIAIAEDAFATTASSVVNFAQYNEGSYKLTFGSLSSYDSTHTVGAAFSAVENEAGKFQYVSDYTPEQFNSAPNTSSGLTDATVTSYTYQGVANHFGFTLGGMSSLFEGTKTGEEIGTYFTLEKFEAGEAGVVKLKQAALAGLSTAQDGKITLTAVDTVGGAEGSTNNNMIGISLALDTDVTLKPTVVAATLSEGSGDNAGKFVYNSAGSTAGYFLVTSGADSGAVKYAAQTYADQFVISGIDLDKVTVGNNLIIGEAANNTVGVTLKASALAAGASSITFQDLNSTLTSADDATYSLVLASEGEGSINTSDSATPATITAAGASTGGKYTSFQYTDTLTAAYYKLLADSDTGYVASTTTYKYVAETGGDTFTISNLKEMTAAEIGGLSVGTSIIVSAVAGGGSYVALTDAVLPTTLASDKVIELTADTGKYRGYGLSLGAGVATADTIAEAFAGENGTYTYTKAGNSAGFALNDNKQIIYQAATGGNMFSIAGLSTTGLGLSAIGSAVKIDGANITVTAAALPATRAERIVLTDLNTSDGVEYKALVFDGIATVDAPKEGTGTASIAAAAAGASSATVVYTTKLTPEYYDVAGASTVNYATTYKYVAEVGGLSLSVGGFSTGLTGATGITFAEATVQGQTETGITVTIKDKGVFGTSDITLGTVPTGYTATLTASEGLLSTAGTSHAATFDANGNYTAARFDSYFSADSTTKLKYNAATGGEPFKITGIVDLSSAASEVSGNVTTFKVGGSSALTIDKSSGNVTVFEAALPTNRATDSSYSGITFTDTAKDEVNYKLVFGSGINTKASVENGSVSSVKDTVTYTTKHTGEWFNGSGSAVGEGSTLYAYTAPIGGKNITISGLSSGLKVTEGAITGLSFEEGSLSGTNIPVTATISDKNVLAGTNVEIKAADGYKAILALNGIPTTAETLESAWSAVTKGVTKYEIGAVSDYYTLGGDSTTLKYTAPKAGKTDIELAGVADKANLTSFTPTKATEGGVSAFKFDKADIAGTDGVSVTSNTGKYAFDIAAAMKFFGTADADNISVSAGTVDAGAGNDLIDVTAAALVYGGAGNDIFNVKAGTVDGGAGNDSFNLTGAATVVLSDGSDSVNYGSGLTVSVAGASSAGLNANLVKTDKDGVYDVQIMDGSKTLNITGLSGAAVQTTEGGLSATATINVMFSDGKQAVKVSLSNLEEMVTWNNNKTAVTLNDANVASPKLPYTLPQFTPNQYGKDAPKLVTISAAGVEAAGLYIQGNDRNNYIVAGTGGNKLDGGKGTDTFVAGEGNDTLVLNAQASGLVIQKFGEDDVIQVTGGASAVTTSLKGNDVIFTVAEVGNVTVVGGANVSTPDSGNTITLIDETGAEISSNLYNKFGIVDGTSISLLSADKSFTASGSLVSVDATDSSVVTLNANSTAGTTIIGNTKANVINGNAGDDLLNGVKGKNTLNGGAGNDTLVGGEGVDLFVDSVGANVIQGYEAGDKIQLDLDVFKNVTFSTGGASDVTFSDENGNSVMVVGGADGKTPITFVNAKGTTTATNIYDTTGSFNKDFTAVTLAANITGGFDAESKKDIYPKLATIDSSAVTTASASIKAIENKATHLTNEGNTVALNLVGSSANDVLTAGEAGDTLVGNGGKDTMIASSVEAADTFVFTAGSSNGLVIQGFGTGDKIQVTTSAADSNASLTTDAEVTKQGDVIFTVYNDKKKYGTVTVDGAAAKNNVQIALALGGSTTNNFYSKDGIVNADNTAITLNSFYGEKEYTAADGIVSVNAEATSKLVTLTGAGGGNLIANVKNNVLVGAGGDSLVGGKGNDTFAVGSGDYVADYGVGSDKVSLSAFNMSQLTGVSITPNTAASGDTPASDNGVIALAFDGGEVSIHAENTAKEIDIIDENNPKGNGFRFVDGGIAEGKSVTILTAPSEAINMSIDAYKPFNELVANVAVTVNGKDAATTIDLTQGGQATGGSKADKLFAQEAATLDGGAGNDTLFATSGQLTGGAGNDLFVYNGGEVTITDYGTGNDKVSLGAGWSITDVTAAGVLTVSDGENSGTIDLSQGYQSGDKLTLVTTTETTNAKGVTKTKSSTSNIYLGDGVISNNSEITKAKSVTVLSGAGGDFGSIEGSGSSAKAAYSVSSIISGAAGTDVVGTNKANTIVLENGGTGKGGLGNDTYIIKGGDVTISDFGIGTKSALNPNGGEDDAVIKLPTAINTVAGKKDSIVAYSDDTYAPGKDSVKINGKITGANVNVNETAGSFSVTLNVDYGDSTGTVTLENILRGYKWKKGEPIEANSLAKDFGKVTIYQAVNGDEKYKKTTLAKLGVSADDFSSGDASLSDLVSSADIGGDVTANNYGTFGGNMSGDAVLASAGTTSTKK